MATQNFRVKNGLEVGLGATIFYAKENGSIGIGSTNPLVALDVAGVIREELHSPTMPVGLNNDIGVNWTQIEMGAGLEAIQSLVYCGNGIVLAGAGNGTGEGDVYRSTDYGRTFIKIEMGSALETIQSLVYCGNGIVLAGSGINNGDGDIYRSTDYGLTWTKIEMEPPGSNLNVIWSLVYCGNGIVIAGSGWNTDEGDVYRSTDFGLTWTKVEMGSSLESIYSLVYCGNGIVLAGSSLSSPAGSGDVYRSTDYGQNWTKIEMEPPGSGLESITSLVYCGNGIVLAGSGDGTGDGDVYRSTDFGLTWTQIEMGAGLEYITSLVYCGNGIVLAGSGNGTGDGDVYRSTDFGLTWTQIEMGAGLEAIQSLVYCGNGIVIAGGGFSTGDGDIYRSDVGFSQATSLQGVYHEHLTGNIGIGTTVPTAKLDVNGTTRLRGALYDFNNATGNPGELLTTTGAGVSWTTSTTTPAGRSVISASAGTPYYITASSVNSGVSSAAYVESDIVIKDGNIGIGTTNPQTTLHVVDEFLLSTAGAASTQRITQRAYTLDNGSLSWEGSAGQLFSITNNLTSGSIFSVNDVSGIPSIDVDANGTIQLASYVTSDYVGIGLTNPQAKLDVNGSTIISSTSAGPLNLFKYGTSAPTILMYGANGTDTSPTQTLTGDVIGGLNMFGYGPSGWAGGPSVRITAVATENNGGTINRGADIKFETVINGGISLQERMRLTNAGNLGIGTTNPQTTLDVNGNVLVGIGLTTEVGVNIRGNDATAYTPTGSGSGYPDSYIGLEIRNDSGGFGGGQGASALMRFSANNNGGYYNWWYAGSIATEDANRAGNFVIGSRDSGSNWSERLRIDAAGNIGIGTTNPQAKLDVSGGLIVSGVSTFTNGPVFIGAATSTGTATQRLQVTGGAYVSGSVGIGTTNPQYKLHVVGDFGATTKSFVIPHPSKPGMKLRYGSLESPYHGIRLTGSSVIEDGLCVVNLPDYICDLVSEEGVNINITNIKHGKVIWVEEVNIQENKFIVMTEEKVGEYAFYWDFTAIRKDVSNLVTEY